MSCCLDCKVEAPDVDEDDENSFIGILSPSGEKVEQHRDDAWPLEHYGYVYEGLRQVGWQSLEAVTLRSGVASITLTVC